MLDLNRIQVDKFKIENSFSFEEVEKNKNEIEKYLIKMEEIFDNFLKINLPLKKKELFLNGVNLRGYESFENGVYNIYVEKKYIGLGIIKNGTLKRDIII